MILLLFGKPHSGSLTTRLLRRLPLWPAKIVSFSDPHLNTDRLRDLDSILSRLKTRESHIPLLRFNHKHNLRKQQSSELLANSREIAFIFDILLWLHRDQKVLDQS